jgi:hypothetical protein
MKLTSIAHKLVHYFDVVADEFWKMTFLQATSKFQFLCILVILSIGFIAFTNNALRVYLEQYARAGSRRVQDELEGGVTDSDLEEELSMLGRWEV